MRAFHSPTANVKRRTDKFVNAERLGSNRGANNVHQCVHRADLVEMNFLDRNIMDFGFGFAQLLENANGSGFGGFADFCFANDLANLI